MRRHKPEHLAALAAGHPKWVVAVAFTPAARRLTALLIERPHTTAALAERAGYTVGTVNQTLWALRHIGKVEHPAPDQWRIA